MREDIGHMAYALAKMTSRRNSNSIVPWLVMAGIVALAVLALRLEGQRWWCACGGARPWISNVWTEHCSRHLADPYTLTHVSHGLIFFAALAWLRPKWSLAARLCISIGIAALWEVVENSSFVIDRYRNHTMSVEYLGDSVANALGDIAACVLGFAFAHRFGLLAALLAFFAMEVALAIMIRDNLTLSTLMLIHPFEGIKAWQMAGRLP
jgi:hypothetical protein